MHDHITISLFELSNCFSTQDSARAFLEEERWHGTRVCPFCGTVIHQRVERKGFYRCGTCNQVHSVRTGTIFERSHIGLHKWLFAIYSFDDGERFEPDFLLFLRKKNSDRFEQLQLFIEPKGTHLLEKDKWKEDCLLQIKECGIPVKEFKDDNTYHIIGLPFFNRFKRMEQFNESMNENS